MISYPRWKIALVAIVLAGRDPARAAQSVRRRKRAAVRARTAPLLPADRTDIETAAQGQGRQAERRLPGSRPSDAALRATSGPVEGARHRRRSAARINFTIALSQGLARARVDAQPRLESAETRPRPARRRLPGLSGRRAGAVKQQLDHHEQDFRASLRNARVPYQDVQVDYPAEPRAGPVPRCRQPRQGQGGDPRRQPQPEPDRRHGRRSAGAQLRADAAGNQGARGLRGPTEHRHPAQPPEQPRARGVRAAGRAPGRRPDRDPTAGSAEFGRGQEDPRQDRDARVSHGRRDRQSARGGGDRPRAARRQTLLHARQAARAAEARSRRHRRPADRRHLPAEHPGRRRRCRSASTAAARRRCSRTPRRTSAT